jgi:hypothetical protein
MSNPEISRRCAACGATIRQRAMYCPQCGSEIEDKDGAAAKPVDPTVTISDLADTIVEKREARTNVAAPEPAKFDPSVTQPLRPALPPTEPLHPLKHRVDEKAQTQALSAVRLPPQVATPKAPAGGTGKVSKLKKVSTAVLDQAAYDPSARFLLIAALLFIVFVVLLVLSKVLR